MPSRRRSQQKAKGAERRAAARAGDHKKTGGLAGLPPAGCGAGPAARSAREAHPAPDTDLAALLPDIRACRFCRETPTGRPLPHEPRPVIRAAATARLGVFSQAPGTRVHAAGVPFVDPSGDRLREWMGVTAPEFYDETRVAIVPMGFCFPGLDSHGGDLPPRRECSPLWRTRVMAALPRLELVLLVGSYALRWHVPGTARASLSEVVADWRRIYADGIEAGGRRVRALPLPHPSWRNNAWIKRNPWFEAELLPVLRAAVGDAIG